MDFNETMESLGIPSGFFNWQTLLNAVILLLVCLVVIKILMRIVDRMLAKSRVEKTMHTFIRSCIKYLLLFIAILMVAGALGVNVTSLIALLGIFGLAVSLAVQGVLSNLAGGIMVLLSKPFKLGDYVLVGDTEGTIKQIGLTHTQINTLDAVIAENPNVLCLCAGDMDSCLAQLEAAEENGIPVVVFDSTVADDDLISAYRGTDNVAVGKIAAQRLSSKLSGQGKILVFSATEKSATVRSRVAGFLEELAGQSGITLIDVIYQDQVDDLGTAMKEALEANPDVAGIYCTNGDTADLFLSVVFHQIVVLIIYIF